MPDPTARLAAALAGRYRIERELGAGGMAAFYLAEGWSTTGYRIPEGCGSGSDD